MNERTDDRVLGMDLAIARLTNGASQRAVAKAMRVAPQRVSQIERTTFVKSDTAGRYMDALDAVLRHRP